MKGLQISRLLYAAIALAAWPGVSRAQQTSGAVPQVLTVGRGEVEVKPDRARLEVGVETRASSAAAAAAENSRRQRGVLDTLQRMGILPDQIQTANLQVTPEMVYPGQGQPPRVSGYVARNSVRVEVLKLEQTGSLVDAALAKGATGVMGVNFYSSKHAEARREALARAVVAARLDAEAMAKAAGYQLGLLLEISSGGPSDGPIMLAMATSPRMAAMADQTPVNPGEIKVSESVTVRWAIKQ
ncbi:MAG: SIMPL domain-containing protein [Gemmatimonadota bacterium]|nr:SIMPL domain-containing protein [Gemmatimonadota bacterium]